MNEKRIQQVLEIEKQAQASYEAAITEAQEIPVKAEQEAQLVVEKARVDAETEAKQMIEKANSNEESDKIMAQAAEKVHRSEVLANTNFKRAVDFVLCRVVGKE